jgi:hypothetical protein
MPRYNTIADTANAAVRAFLTQVGAHYFTRPFDTGHGESKNDWKEIRDIVFQGRCAYCGSKYSHLQLEHLKMINCIEYGLHHPGNTVPCCKPCNSSRKRGTKNFHTWEQHLKEVCKRKGDIDKFPERKDRILKHMKYGKYKYPSLTGGEMDAIRIVADNLYERIKTEQEKAVALYIELQEALSIDRANMLQNKY